MIRVGVIRGGTHDGYNASLASGAYVLKNLPRDKYELVDIFVDSEGVWHIGGKPVSHETLHHRVDVVWNALNGFYGADGKVEHLLGSLSIPHTGAGPFVSALSMHKKIAKDHLAAIGALVPRGIYIESWGEGDREATVPPVVARIAHDFSPPWIIEPISRGYGTPAVRARTLGELVAALQYSFDFSIPVSVEEEVLGTRVSVISVAGLRGQKTYTFLPNSTRSWRGSESDAIQGLARTVHERLELGPYSRIEVIVGLNGRLYVSNIDTVPSFAPESDIHTALVGTGVSFRELADQLLFSTLRKQ